MNKKEDKSTSKDNIDWLECLEEVPEWLNAMFKGENYIKRMDALKKINIDSMNCRVENN